MLLSEKEAKAMCEKLLGYVKAEDAAVNVSSEVYSHLRFAANSFTTSGRRENVTANVAVWMEKKRGSASTNETDDAALRAAVEQAEQLARVSPVDREYLPTLGPQEYPPTGGYVEATAKISLASRAKAIHEAIAACEKEKVMGAGFHQSRGTAGASATKNGNLNYNRSSLVSLGMTARTTEGNGSGYFLRNHFDVAKLDAARVSREAIQKALRSREPRTLDAGKYTVVLEAQAVADLLGFFGFVFDARSADEGRSPFSAPGGKTRVGEKISDERINIYSDPWHPELPGSPSAQGGLPAKKLYLVRNGVLEQLVYSRFWAKQKEKEPTPGPVNTIMESSAPPVSFDDMIKDTKRGLLVTRFWYIRPVNPQTVQQTGLTRDGLFLIENGKITAPVVNFRFNESPVRLLQNVAAMGQPVRVRGGEGAGMIAPPLVVNDFPFTSVSDAV